MDKNKVLAMMNSSVDNNLNLNSSYIIGDYNVTDNNKTLSCWGYYRDYYYPTVIHESYPVYLRERAQDKGKQAFEILKVLKDKNMVKLEKVSDFIDIMDELIKIL